MNKEGKDLIYKTIAKEPKKKNQSEKRKEMIRKIPDRFFKFRTGLFR